MRFLHGITDEKFVQKHALRRAVASDLGSPKFVHPKILEESTHFDRNAVPLPFKQNPETLLNLCAQIVDNAVKLPSVYKWTNNEVCCWIRRYGYPQYMGTLRENLITGLKLLLLDATALCAMNIRNFDHIKHIAYGIRQLFYFEMTKFGRSLTLTPDFHLELYKLFRVKSGYCCDTMKPTDLWRKIGIVRKRTKYLLHWELFDQWLTIEPQRETEITGGIHRYNVFRCIEDTPIKELAKIYKKCTCTPPCQCYWNEKDVQKYQVLSVIKGGYIRIPEISTCSRNCMPPCTCGWASRTFKTHTVLACLQRSFPSKYGSLRQPRYRQTSVLVTDREWARRSLWTW